MPQLSRPPLSTVSGAAGPAPLFRACLAARPGAPPISLSLAAGDCLGLAGPSGCGKSRLLRRLADLDPHDGDLLLDGCSYRSLPPSQWRRQVALLPADSHWWAAEVEAHFCAPPPPDWLGKLALPADCLRWAPERLSSGERARLALLRALVNRPRVLLLDEPCANLDADSAGRVEALVLDYLREQAAAAIWVAHDAAQLDRVASQRLTLTASGAAVSA